MTATQHDDTAAQNTAARGWHVFPLVPGTKRPAIGAWEARATTDPDRIRACWRSAPFGIGIACGPSRLVVVDLDVPKPDTAPPPEWRRPGVVDGRDVLAALCDDARQPWPDTYTVTTPSGGLHLYCRQPADRRLRNTHGRLGWLIDTRGHGGYVAAPGTTIHDRTYRVIEDTDPGELPGWLGDRLAADESAPLAAPPSVQLRTGKDDAYARAAIDNQVAHVRSATVKGRRNFTLYMAAQNLGQLVAGGLLDEPTVRAVLLAAAEHHLAIGAYTVKEAHDTITSGLRAGARRPRQVNAA